MSLADYYARHYYSACRYAAAYLRQIEGGDPRLARAANAYAEVAASLRPVWSYFSRKGEPEAAGLHSLAEQIRAAKHFEEEGIRGIREYLAGV